MESKTLAGSAVLSALVVVFDYSIKFSGLKIPFPWLPFLKFDFTGAPIILSTLLYGITPGATTSTVAFLAILVRSGDLIGASMKALAEFTTTLGITLSHTTPITQKHHKTAALLLGVTSRSATMALANLLILPAYYKIPLPTTITLLPLITAFNAAQGAISLLLGHLLYTIITHRTPLAPKKHRKTKLRPKLS